MTVLILSGAKGDTRRYRTFHPYEQLRLAGVNCLLTHITDPKLIARSVRSQMVIIHRASYDSCVSQLIKSVHRVGGLAILDVDDLIFDPAAFQWIDSPDFSDPLRSSLYLEEMRRQRLTLDACPVVTASTDFLAEEVRRLGKPVWVHRNAFSLEMLVGAEAAYAGRKEKGSRLVIGYASGTPTHDRDFALIRPALEQILSRYPQVEVWTIGPLDLGKDWGSLAKRIKQLSLVPWRKLPEVLAQFDINLAPLVMDNPFAQSKSEIKYMEAGLVRVPTVASSTEAYRYAIRPGENGYLAADLTEWIDALDLLVRQADVRAAVGDSAYVDVLARYQPAQRSAELLATLNQAYEQGMGKPFWTPEALLQMRKQASMPGAVEFRIDPAIERSPSLAHMALYALQRRGVRTFWTRIWVFFRRLVAPWVPFNRAR